MTNNSLYTATVDNLLKQANIDFKIEDAFMRINAEDFSEEEVTPDNADAFAIARYAKDNNINICSTFLSLNQYRTLLTSKLTDIMMNRITNSKIFFRQSYEPYFFKIYSESFTIFLPLVLTRAFMCLLKIYGVKCEAEKRNKSLCKDLDIYFTELCFTGKSTIDKPELKPIADACKNIKGRINPWYREDEEVEEENTEKYSEANLRFRGAEWFEATQKNVTLIGAGGISSNIAVSLCRVLGNMTLTIFDPDIVEHKNLAGQNFGISDIGLNKANVVGSQCLNFNPELHVLGETCRFNESQYADDITITGLDNMATRSLVFSKWLGLMGDSEEINKKRLLIDARLSAEKWQIFCITGDNKAAQKEYEDKWLFTDEDADSDVCSYKQTAFAAQMCASFVTNLYINFCTNLTKSDDDPLRRYIPFMTEYDATQMILRYKDI